MYQNPRCAMKPIPILHLDIFLRILTVCFMHADKISISILAIFSSHVYNISTTPHIYFQLCITCILHRGVPSRLGPVQNFGDHPGVVPMALQGGDDLLFRLARVTLLQVAQQEVAVFGPIVRPRGGRLRDPHARNLRDPHAKAFAPLPGDHGEWLGAFFWSYRYAKIFTLICCYKGPLSWSLNGMRTAFQETLMVIQ